MLFFISLTLFVTCRSALGICVEGCTEPTLFYESLNCAPIYKSPTDCCPIRYDCSEFEARVEADRDDVCYFEGRAYNVGETVDEHLVYRNCESNVRCKRDNPKKKANFVRRYVDCHTYLTTSDCHLKYELDKCCHTGKICAPYTATCIVNGETYHEYQTFQHPFENCTVCICQVGYDGLSNGPYCMKKKCVEEVINQLELYSFCAPFYWHKYNCCPSNWICPERNDFRGLYSTVTSSEEASHPACEPRPLNVSTSPGETCTYGKTKLNIGCAFRRNEWSDSFTVCECKIPPFLTCYSVKKLSISNSLSLK